MKVIGTLCYFAESPTWLAATVASMARVCDHVVACDGGYRLFPGATASSGSACHEAITMTAEATGVGLTHYVPAGVYEGNEVEKRNVAFRLAEAIAEPGEDWYFVLDADEVVIEDSPMLREDLSLTPLDVATVSMLTRVDWQANEQRAMVARAGFCPSTPSAPERRLFRAIPGLAVVGNHYTFVTPDGRTLRGQEHLGIEPALQTAVVFEHRSDVRDRERHIRKMDYYQLREAAGAETKPGEPVMA